MTKPAYRLQQQAAYKSPALVRLTGEKRVYRRGHATKAVCKCRQCGCTNTNQCQSASRGPCYWVTPAGDLCSACAQQWDDVSQEMARSRGSAKNV